MRPCGSCGTRVSVNKDAGITLINKYYLHPLHISLLLLSLYYYYFYYYLIIIIFTSTQVPPQDVTLL